MEELEIGEDGFNKVGIDVEMEAYNTKRKPMKFKLRNSKSKLVRQILNNNSDEEFKVLGQIDLKTSWGDYRYFLIEFRDNTRLIAHIESIKKGEVKNPNSPSVYDVGFMGQGEYRCTMNGKKTKEYNTWMGMMTRCYSTRTQERQPTYRDCMVAPRWHNFQNFCEDIKELEGYMEWKEGQSEKINPYELDKDIKIEENKVYSKDTCMFVNHVDNTLKAKLTGKLYRGISPDGEEFVFDNISEFAREHGLDSRNICNCLFGRCKTHKGWQFKELIEKLLAKEMLENYRDVFEALA